MDYKDYYQTLGVAPHASADDVKQAYRRLVRKYHPDVSHASDADHKTQEINEAYAVLGDRDRRAVYDAAATRLRAARQQFTPPPDRGQQAFGPRVFDEHALGARFFADLFSHVGRQAYPGTHARRGDDVQAVLAVTLYEAYHGGARALAVPGTGRPGAQRASVIIPAGVTHGQQLRVPGHGLPGYGGGPAGDLMLLVQLRPEPQYWVEGRHVTARLPVAPWEAVLGAGIEIATPSGPLHVTVPAGSQGGRKLRLRGRGIPALGSEAAGDLFLELDIIWPPATTPRARELYQAMARELAFNPRAGGQGTGFH